MAKRAPSYWRVLLSECENAIFWTRNSSQSTMTETTAKGNDYKPYLVRMMNFIDEPDPPYTNATTFSVEHLSNITAKDYMRHVNFRVYGVAEPPPGHTLAPMQRTSTVEYQKKAISFYMPNRLMQWNELSLVGNPTRCTEIGDFIRVLRTKETRGQGRPSCARASVDATEFESMHTIMREEGKDSRAKYGFRAFLNVQNHFIARVDDTAKMFLENLQVAHGYDFILKAKLNWGKNVREERDCPFQHMMASNDHRFCCHLTLAVWLEVYLTENAAQGAMTPYVFTFSDNISVPDGAVQSNLCSRTRFLQVHKKIEELTAFESFPRQQLVGMALVKTIRTCVGDGRLGNECQMTTMTWSYHILMQRLLLCCVQVAQ
jgi:hypothetical protein